MAGDQTDSVETAITYNARGLLRVTGMEWSAADQRFDVLAVRIPINRTVGNLGGADVPEPRCDHPGAAVRLLFDEGNAASLRRPVRQCRFTGAVNDDGHTLRGSRSLHER